MNIIVTQLVSLLKIYFPTLEREEGQGMVEYALILALLAIAAVVAIGLAGDQLVVMWNAIATALTPS